MEKKQSDLCLEITRVRIKQRYSTENLFEIQTEQHVVARERSDRRLRDEAEAI